MFINVCNDSCCLVGVVRGSGFVIMQRPLQFKLHFDLLNWCVSQHDRFGDAFNAVAIKSLWKYGRYTSFENVYSFCKGVMSLESAKPSGSELLTLIIWMSTACQTHTALTPIQCIGPRGIRVQ